MSAIRVLIVDDHPVTREGLHAALDLANDVVVVGEADSGENAVEEARKLTPDIVFMDVRKPGMSGIDATKAIREASPTTKVILITVDEPRASMAEALQAGVSGYLLNVPSADELVSVARLVLGMRPLARHGPTHRRFRRPLRRHSLSRCSRLRTFQRMLASLCVGRPAPDINQSDRLRGGQDAPGGARRDAAGRRAITRGAYLQSGEPDAAPIVMFRATPSRRAAGSPRHRSWGGYGVVGDDPENRTVTERQYITGP